MIAIVIISIFCSLWVSALCCGILFILNAHYECYAYKGLFRKSFDDDAQLISVISYNVNLAYQELSTLEKAEKIADYLLEKNADIVLLQEYNPQVFPVLHKKLAGNYLYGSPYELADRYKAVYSKFPISNYIQLKDVHDTKNDKTGNEDRSYLPICEMTVTVNNHSFNMVNCHLHSNNFSPALRRLRCNEMSFFYFLRTIINSLSYGIQIRRRQAGVLRKQLNDIRIPILICGDMNDVSASSVLRALKGKNLRDAWWEKGVGQGHTLCVKLMKWRLDHILFSKGIKIDSVIVEKIGLSDHRPLQCKFHLLS